MSQRNLDRILFKIHLNIIPICSYVSRVTLSLQVFRLKFCTHFPYFHACFMSSLSLLDLMTLTIFGKGYVFETPRYAILSYSWCFLSSLSLSQVQINNNLDLGHPSV